MRIIFVLLALLLIPFSIVFGEIKNEIGVEVPKASMEKLEYLANGLAKLYELEVKVIRFDTQWHPNDKAVAIIEFKEIDLGNGAYEFNEQIFRNENWPSKYDTKSSYSSYAKDLEPASTKWIPSHFYRRIEHKIKIDDSFIFVYFAKGLEASDGRKYIQKFITWAKNNPDLFKHNLKKMTRAEYNKIEKKIEIYFDRKNGGQYYIFNVSNDKFIFENTALWFS